MLIKKITFSCNFFLILFCHFKRKLYLCSVKQKKKTSQTRKEKEMKSFSDLLLENRTEFIEFLEKQENKEFVFVKWDEEKQSWIDRDGESCYPCDAAPNVLLADNNDLVYGNVVISAKYVDNLRYRVKLITDGTCIDEPAIDIIDVPMNYLAGNTELEIYEWVVRNL